MLLQTLSAPASQAALPARKRNAECPGTWACSSYVSVWGKQLGGNSEWKKTQEVATCPVFCFRLHLPKASFGEGKETRCDDSTLPVAWSFVSWAVFGFCCWKPPTVAWSTSLPLVPSLRLLERGQSRELKSCLAEKETLGFWHSSRWPCDYCPCCCFL